MTQFPQPERTIYPNNQFVFARIQYNNWSGGWGWDTDFPDSDRNFPLRLSELTTIDVPFEPSGEPKHVVLRLTDEALFNYPFIYMLEVGRLEFSEEEVKALREGRANLRDAYAVVKSGELWLLNCHISAYSHSGYSFPDALRTRKLLLHKDEILKLAGRVQAKGFTLVPTKFYFKNGRAKCELALVKGKKVWDRRDTIRQRTAQREIDQELKRYR